MSRCLAMMRFITVSALLLGGEMPTAQAQSIPLTFEPLSTTAPVLEDRPTLTEWVASVRGGGLVEGRIELRLTAISAAMPSEFLGTVRTDELVFSGENQRVRVQIPPYHWASGPDEIVIRPFLITKLGTVELPEQRLRTPMPIARKFPLLLGETKTRPRTKPGEVLVRDKFADQLRFESLLPENLKDRALTIVNHLDVADFPQDPLAYCQHELVAVTGDVFSGLRGPQLEALLKWVRAGGSLCLEPSGLLSPSHAEFLNRLVAEDDRKLVFVLNDQGRIAGSIAEGQEPLKIDCGLGRALLSLTLEETLAEKSAQPAIAWLWKISPDAAADLQNGIAPVALEEARIQQSVQGYYLGLPSPFIEDVTSQLVDWLRPQGVRMVPLSVIASLLCVLVICIGPVDYFVLSFLQRRKWTWLTFPGMVLVATLLMVSITNAYLSTAETRRAVIMHDVADDGEIVRTNRFELLFTSATRRARTPMQSSLLIPLLTGGYTDPRMRAAGYRQQVTTVKGADGKTYQRVVNVPISSTMTEPILYEGRIPSRYQTVQEIRQWTPQLNRGLSIGAAAQSPAVDWSAITVPSDISQQAQCDEMLTQIRRQLGPDAQAALVFPGQTWSSEAKSSSQAYPQNSYPQNYNNIAWEHLPKFDASPRMNSLLRLTSAQQYGVFALVNRTSPHGGSSLDDLPLAMNNAVNRRWLVILIPEGDDFVVYRKSYPAAG